MAFSFECQYSCIVDNISDINYGLKSSYNLRETKTPQFVMKNYELQRLTGYRKRTPTMSNVCLASKLFLNNMLYITDPLTRLLRATHMMPISWRKFILTCTRVQVQTDKNEHLTRLLIELKTTDVGLIIVDDQDYHLDEMVSKST